MRQETNVNVHLTRDIILHIVLKRFKTRQHNYVVLIINHLFAKTYPNRNFLKLAAQVTQFGKVKCVGLLIDIRSGKGDETGSD